MVYTVYQEMELLSDILRETGLSHPTVFKYVQLGIVPRPTRVWRGRKGSESWFPDGTIKIIDRVREQKSQGYTLNQIAERGREPMVKPESFRTWGYMTDASQARSNVFLELFMKYPEDEFVSSNVKEISGKDGNSIVVQVELTKMRRR